MAHERIKPEFLFDEEKIKQLIQIAPECFEDGKINFETLRQNLGDWDHNDEENEIEHFGLFWPGKKEARKAASIPPEGTLEPVFGEGLKKDGSTDEDGKNDSKNIFIEGENLEVLKLLQKSYANKIKMIYIDPPYNTGSDFIYDDDFTEPLQEYLKRTGQIDEEGKPLTTNKKSDGRFHSKWLSMMYPRLRLARNLLKDDGVIFISIDDNEVHNLRAIMNEIFGEENFFGTIVWKKKTNGNNVGNIPPVHDYILAYGKDTSGNTLLGFPLSEEYIKKNYSNPDNDPRGLWTTMDLSANHEGPYFEITNPNTQVKYLPPSGRYWVFNEEEVKKRIEKGTIIFGKTGKSAPIQKKFLSEKDSLRIKPDSWWDKHGFNSDGTEEINKYLGPKFFSHPKPSKLIKNLINIATQENDIVLDFFAGSGTTTCAVFEQNREDNQNRISISVQMPETIDEKHVAFKAGYKYVTQLTKKRISNYIKLSDINASFKVFKLSFSSYKKWRDIFDTELETLENEIDLFSTSPLRNDWNKNKLMTELILLEGFPLDSQLDKALIGNNEIIKIESELVPNSLLICLDDEINVDLIDQLSLNNQITFICLDSAISNQNKLRLSDKGFIKTI